MKVTKSYLKQVILEELQQEVASMEEAQVDESQVDESQLDEGALGNVSMAALLALSTAITGMEITKAKRSLDDLNARIASSNAEKVDEVDAKNVFKELTGKTPEESRMNLQSGALQIFLAGQVRDGNITIDGMGKITITKKGTEAAKLLKSTK